MHRAKRNETCLRHSDTCEVQWGKDSSHSPCSPKHRAKKVWNPSQTLRRGERGPHMCGVLWGYNRMWEEYEWDMGVISVWNMTLDLECLTYWIWYNEDLYAANKKLGVTEVQLRCGRKKLDSDLESFFQALDKDTAKLNGSHQDASSKITMVKC